MRILLLRFLESPDIDGTSRLKIKQDLNPSFRCRISRHPISLRERIFLSVVGADCAHLDIAKIAMDGAFHGGSPIAI